MLKRNKKIAQICALAMCINLIQGSFVNGYASEAELSNNDALEEVVDSLESESDVISEDEIDDIESEVTDDMSDNTENLEVEDKQDLETVSDNESSDDVVNDIESDSIDNEEAAEISSDDSSSDIVTINFNQYEKISDNTLRLINGKDGFRGNIEIPESAEIDGKTYTITEIGE